MKSILIIFIFFLLVGPVVPGGEKKIKKIKWDAVFKGPILETSLTCKKMNHRKNQTDAMVLQCFCIQIYLYFIYIYYEALSSILYRRSVLNIIL